MNRKSTRAHRSVCGCYARLTALGLVLMAPAGLSEARADAGPDVKPDRPAPQAWSSLLDAAAADATCKAIRAHVVEQAEETLGNARFGQPKTLAELKAGEGRSRYDPRAESLKRENQAPFALAMSDMVMMKDLETEMVLQAAVFRLTRDSRFRDRIVAQLEEVASWQTFQRQGWSLYSSEKGLPGGGRDGVWLGTGRGIRAVADTLAILPDTSLPAPLTAALSNLLEREIDRIVADWKSGVPGFVSDNAVGSLPWIVVSDGLIRACLTLGRDSHADAYEMGITHMLLALDAQGENGEYRDGLVFSYLEAVDAMLSAAHAAALDGDRRLLDHPFLRHLSSWIAHHIQPGNNLVNAFDAVSSARQAHAMRDALRQRVAVLVYTTCDPVARWMLQEQLGGAPDTLQGLAAAAVLAQPAVTAAPPPPYAYYNAGELAVWRSSWKSDASGLWVRGGSPDDTNDHHDRGHVSLTLHGEPVLIEAGTADRNEKRLMSHYQSGPSHNVLQVGFENPDEHIGVRQAHGWPACKPATVTVKRLDADGGELQIDASACYENIKQWKRIVQWDANRLSVQDLVDIPGNSVEVVLFRWHLGTDAEVAITDVKKQSVRVLTPTALITLTASAPIVVTQIKMPDHTLFADQQAHLHTCLVIRCTDPFSGRFALKTEMESPPVAAAAP